MTIQAYFRDLEPLTIWEDRQAVTQIHNHFPLSIRALKTKKIRYIIPPTKNNSNISLLFNFFINILYEIILVCGI